MYQQLIVFYHENYLQGHAHNQVKIRMKQYRFELGHRCGQEL